MPMYNYTCMVCDENTDRLVKIADRDGQSCDECGYKLFREIVFTGLVWSPTANGGLK